MVPLFSSVRQTLYVLRLLHVPQGLSVRWLFYLPCELRLVRLMRIASDVPDVVIFTVLDSRAGAEHHRRLQKNIIRHP
jgi:hypothetical protein